MPAQIKLHYKLLLRPRRGSLIDWAFLLGAATALALVFALSGALVRGSGLG
jgi:hypothetical protein